MKYLYPINSPWRPVVLVVVMLVLALADNYVQQIAVSTYLAGE